MSHKERVRGIAIHRPIIYGNVAHWVAPQSRPGSWPTEHTHRWTVAVRSATGPAPPDHRARHPRHDEDLSIEPTVDDDDLVGGADDLTHYIKRVTFKLHDTYPNPNRSIDKPPFQVTETGWGEFEIAIKIFFVNESGEKPLQLFHNLKLHEWKVPAPKAGLGPAGEGEGEGESEGEEGKEQKPVEKEKEDGTTTNGTAAPELPGPARALKPGEPLEGAPKPVDDLMDLDADGEIDLEGPPAPADPTAQTSTAEAPPAEAATTTTPTPSKRPINSWLYDEIIFTSPTETFYATLLSLPPTPLPQTARPGRTAAPLGPAGHGGEISVELEEGEGRRFDWARGEVIRMGEVLRQRLIKGEKELEGLKRDVAELQQSA